MESDVSKFKRFVFPYIRSNMYVWSCAGKRKAIVVDPHQSESARQYLELTGVNEILIILTHEHYDHTSGVNWLREQYDCKVLCHEMCAAAIAIAKNNRPLSIAMLLKDNNKKEELRKLIKETQLYTCKADITFSNRYELEWNKEKILLSHCPGHSKGSVCVLVNNEYLFTGDSLIPDIPVITRYSGGSDVEYSKITLPYLRKINGEVWIMPGHGIPIQMKKLEYMENKFEIRNNEDELCGI